MTTSSRFIEEHWANYQDALSAHTIADIETAIARFTKVNGFNRYGYAARRRSTAPSGQGDYHYFHNIDGPLGESYRHLEAPALADCDPRVLHARNYLPPVSWNSLGESNFVLPPPLRPLARRKLIATGEFGLHSGITIPIHSPGIDWAFITLSATCRTSPRELVPILLTASYFASCLQTAFMRLGMQATGTSEIRLTEQELEILRWSAVGKTSWEIARIRNISESTVNYHLNRVAAKLGVRGRRATIAQAIALGLLVL